MATVVEDTKDAPFELAHCTERFNWPSAWQPASKGECKESIAERKNFKDDALLHSTDAADAGLRIEEDGGVSWELCIHYIKPKTDTQSGEMTRLAAPEDVERPSCSAPPKKRGRSGAASEESLFQIFGAQGFANKHARQSVIDAPAAPTGAAGDALGGAAGRSSIKLSTIDSEWKKRAKHLLK